MLFINCKCYAQLRIAYFTCLDALPSALGAKVPTEQSEAPRSQGSDDSTSTAVVTGATGTATSIAAKVATSGCDGGRDRQSSREGQGVVEPPPLDGSERLGPGIAFTLLAAVPPLPAQPPPTSMECQPVLTPEDDAQVDAMKPPWPHEQPASVCSQASLAQTEITQRAVATSDGVTAVTATAAAAGAAIFQPTMWLGSTWCVTAPLCWRCMGPRRRLVAASSANLLKAPVFDQLYARDIALAALLQYCLRLAWLPPSVMPCCAVLLICDQSR